MNRSRVSGIEKWGDEFLVHIESGDDYVARISGDVKLARPLKLELHLVRYRCGLEKRVA